MKILKFYTPTCMTCRMLGKILDKLEVEVENIDATLPSVQEAYNITSIPTLVFLDDEGKEVKRTEGFITQDKIEEILKSY